MNDNQNYEPTDFTADELTEVPLRVPPVDTRFTVNTSYDLSKKLYFADEVIRQVNVRSIDHFQMPQLEGGAINVWVCYNEEQIDYVVEKLKGSIMVKGIMFRPLLNDHLLTQRQRAGLYQGWLFTRNLIMKINITPAEQQTHNSERDLLNKVKDEWANAMERGLVRVDELRQVRQLVQSANLSMSDDPAVQQRQTPQSQRALIRRIAREYGIKKRKDLDNSPIAG